MDAVKKSLETASKFTNNVRISEFTEQIVREILPTL